MDIPSISVKQANIIERTAQEEYGVGAALMMENAARSVADFVRQEVGNLSGLSVIIMAGRGNNGGDALAAVRHLANGGAEVTAVIACSAEELRGLTRQHADTVSAMGIDIISFSRHGGKRMLNRLKDADIVVDGLLGINGQGAPRGAYADMIAMVNDFAVPVLSLDIPSGLNPDTGEPFDPSIQAAWTITFGLPKVGLLEGVAATYVGELWLADVGIPSVLYSDLGIIADEIFSDASVVELE